MSRGAICTYSFIARIVAPAQLVVVSFAALAVAGEVEVPPQSGWLNRIRVQSAGALTGVNYDVTMWATDSAVPATRAAFEVFRATGIAVVAAPRVDLNQAPNESYSMQIDDDAVFPHVADMQLEIDTGIAELGDRNFRVTVEFQGDQTPTSPTLTRSMVFEQNPF